MLLILLPPLLHTKEIESSGLLLESCMCPNCLDYPAERRDASVLRPDEFPRGFALLAPELRPRARALTGV